MGSENQSECNGHQVKVGAVMTAPRYECVWARSAIEGAFRAIGIPLSVSGGPFYGQCMQTALESALENGLEYVITVDFDSVFMADHIQRLLDIIVQEDDIDAIAAVQPMRGNGRLMASHGTGKPEDVTWQGYPLKVKFAHFGLTCLDVSKLVHVPKPWFASQPNEAGSWNGAKIDDDTWFWKQWDKAGNSLYSDPGCRIGHLEELISVFDSQMNLQRIYPKEWAAFAGETVG